MTERFNPVGRLCKHAGDGAVRPRPDFPQLVQDSTNRKTPTIRDMTSRISSSGLRRWFGLPIIEPVRSSVRLARAVSSVVRAPRSHRGGRRFKSSIAHHRRQSIAGYVNLVVPDSSSRPRWRNGRRAAFRAQCPLRTCGFKSLPRHHPVLA